MNKKQKNILFLLLIVIFIILIMLFNYFVDSFNIFHKTKNMNIATVASDFLVKTYLKSYKNVKHDTLIIGSSDADAMFVNINYLLKNYSNNIFCVKSYKDYYILLKRYLELHPETKNVILVMNYMMIVNGPNINLYDRGNETNLNLKDLTFLLLSVDAMKENINKFYKPLNILLNVNNLISILNTREDKFLLFFDINFLEKYDLNIPGIKLNINENFKYIELIFQLLKEKNIQSTVIIPPYHGLYIVTIYKNKETQKAVEDLQRLIVNKTANVYDFAFINKYTSQPYYMEELKDIQKNFNYYYLSITHPGIIMGTKVYKVLFDPSEGEKDIYIKLTKNNIEEQIKNTNKLTEKYIEENNDKINKYLQNVDSIKQKKIRISTEEAKKNMPDDVAKEYEYLRTKSK